MPITPANAEQVRLKYISQTIISSRDDREKVAAIFDKLDAASKILGDDPNKIYKVTQTKKKLQDNLSALDKKIADKLALWNKVYLGLFKKSVTSATERDSIIIDFANKKF